VVGQPSGQSGFASVDIGHQAGLIAPIDFLQKV
jgi:hypothetical protein